MRMRKKKNLSSRMEKCAAVHIDNPQELKGKWSGLFGNDNPIHIEIGCGKGSFITGMAKKYPKINFVAIEKVEDVIVMAMEKAIGEELKNVFFIDADAETLDETFEKGEIQRIYLNFSDPWKKKKQAKRRLTHKRFLDLYKKLLNNGDYIYFKTDNRALFEFSLNSFAEEGYKLENITFDLHNSDYKDNVMTEYEKRFSEAGMPIYRVEATYLGWTDERKKPTLPEMMQETAAELIDKIKKQPKPKKDSEETEAPAQETK
ncbi:MAG: tRNA (guanosine(46)-N7)-methyltransferase TrmB [Oscillospiraceae bacterium]|nr:tRNA (guanosine(46)-N7)-methyltransferase TrmB [Oscillospiraceae bacterium]